jgi:hypothetical protein
MRERNSILICDTRWRCMINFAPRPPYLWAKSSQCLLNMRLGEPQRTSERIEEEKNILPPRIRGFLG